MTILTVRHINVSNLEVFYSTATFLQLVPSPGGESNRHLCSGLEHKGRAPWCLMTRMLFKVQVQQASLVPVAPVVPAQVWFPGHLESLGHKL